MTWPLPDLNRRLHRLIWLSTRDHHGRVNSELVVESEMAFMLEIVVFINIYTLKLCLTSRLRMDCGAEYKSGPDQAVAILLLTLVLPPEVLYSLGAPHALTRIPEHLRVTFCARHQPAGLSVLDWPP